ncbi:MAG: hypothetical protein ABSH25_12600 [Syntrophorhabdales bacterium]|jgi:hypothetical protein
MAKNLGCADTAGPLAALRLLSGEELLAGTKPVFMPPGDVFPPVVDGRPEA